MKTSKKGFTVAGVLLGISFISNFVVGVSTTLLRSSEKARDAMRKAQIASIQVGVETYALDHDSQYPTSDTVACIEDPNTELAKSIAPYFNGRVPPKDARPVNKKCGFMYFYDTTNKCYAILTKLEYGAANATTVTPDCTKPLPWTGTFPEGFYGITGRY